MNLQKHIQDNYPFDRDPEVKKPVYGKTLEIDGREIFYRERGEGPPILYIHGNLGSHKWFSFCMHMEGFRTIALDLPNFAFSDRIESCEIRNYSDFVSSFIEKLQLKPVILVGHSLGGAVAMDLAVRKPEMISHLMLIDSSSVRGLVTPIESYPVIELYKNDYKILRQALSAIMPGVKDEKRIDELVDSALMMKPDAYSGHADALARFDLSAKAEKLPCPVLFLRGAKDILITGEMARETVDILGGEILELEGVGHSIIVEDPTRFMDILREFVS